MKFQIYFNYTENVKEDENTISEKTTRKRFRNVPQEELSAKLQELINLIPANATGVWLESYKEYDDMEVGY